MGVDILESTTHRVYGYYMNVAWPRGHKTFSCSTQLSMKFELLMYTEIAKINENPKLK